jgi:hypothetical protein
LTAVMAADPLPVPGPADPVPGAADPVPVFGYPAGRR